MVIPADIQMAFVTGAVFVDPTFLWMFVALLTYSAIPYLVVWFVFRPRGRTAS